MSYQFVDCSPYGFFVYFGNFTTYRCRSFSPESFFELNERFEQTKRRFVKNDCAWFFRQFGQSCSSAFLLGKESFETKFFIRQPRCYQCWHKGCRSGQAFDGDISSSALSYQKEPGVGDGRSTGIRNKSYVFSSFYPGDDSLSKCFNNMPLVRVSSAKIQSTSRRTEIALNVMSSRFPTGVGTTYSFAILL